MVSKEAFVVYVASSLGFFHENALLAGCMVLTWCPYIILPHSSSDIHTYCHNNGICIASIFGKFCPKDRIIHDSSLQCIALWAVGCALCTVSCLLLPIYCALFSNLGTDWQRNRPHIPDCRPSWSTVYLQMVVMVWVGYFSLTIAVLINTSYWQRSTRYTDRGHCST